MAFKPALGELHKKHSLHQISPIWDRKSTKKIWGEGTAPSQTPPLVEGNTPSPAHPPQEFQRVWSQSADVTDGRGQRDRQLIMAIPRCATLRTVKSRDKYYYYYYYYYNTRMHNCIYVCIHTESKSWDAVWRQNESNYGDEWEQTAWYEHIHDVVERFSSHVKRERHPSKVAGCHFCWWAVSCKQKNTFNIAQRFPVDSSQVDSSQVDSSRSVHHADGSSHGQFNTGRFITECEKQFAVGAVVTGFVRQCHTTLVGVSRPNLCICAMDVSNDTQHVNTVRDFEVGVTKRGKPSVIHGDFEYLRHRQKSVGQVSHLEMLPVSSNEVSCSWQSRDFINRATHTHMKAMLCHHEAEDNRGCSYATCSTSNSAMKWRWLYQTRMLLHVAFGVIVEHATRLHQLSFHRCKLESTSISSMFLAGTEKWWYVMWMLTATATFWYSVNKISDKSTNMVIKGRRYR